MLGRQIFYKGIMKRILVILFLVSSSCFFQGCFSHYVIRDYPKFLSKRDSEKSLQLPFNAVYELSDQFKESKQEIIVAPVYGHKWVVEVGKMWLKYLELKGLVPATDHDSNNGGPKSDLLLFDLSQYEFLNGSAHIVLSVRQIRSGKEILFKHYSADGDDEFQWMTISVPFGTTNVILRSTTIAFDSIFSQLVKDLRSQDAAPKSGL